MDLNQIVFLDADEYPETVVGGPSGPPTPDLLVDRSVETERLSPCGPRVRFEGKSSTRTIFIRLLMN